MKNNFEFAENFEVLSEEELQNVCGGGYWWLDLFRAVFESPDPIFVPIHGI